MLCSPRLKSVRLSDWSSAMVALFACLALAGCGYSAWGATGRPGSRRLQRHAPVMSAYERPNIVFVLTDDLSWDLVTKKFMPHVIALEHQGATFNNYFVADSWCCPSRASIFTGEFPHNTGVLSNAGDKGGFGAFYRAGDQSHTFAVTLKTQIYRTAMMGKYLNGYMEPGYWGMNPASGVELPNSYRPVGWDEWDVAGKGGYKEFNYRLNENGKIVDYGGPRAWGTNYLTDVLANKGVAFIHQAAQSHQPFFLELATFAPHNPNVPAPRNERDFPGLKAPRPPSFDVLPTDAPTWLRYEPIKDKNKIVGWRPRTLTTKELSNGDHAFRQRAQQVEAVDLMIKRVEKALQETGTAGNTYIVFSSDNGLHIGEYRLTYGKETAFDTDIRVPLIVAGPGIKHDIQIPQFAENIDLAETFAEMAGDTSFSGDGHSLLGLLHGNPEPGWRNAVLIEHHPCGCKQTDDPDFQTGEAGLPGPYHAIRTADFLYVEYGDGSIEFYDLRRDPFELDNIAGQLSPLQRTLLHGELTALKTCQGAASCWNAMHVPLLPGRW